VAGIQRLHGWLDRLHGLDRLQKRC
jgi:hypothetical protein